MYNTNPKILYELEQSYTSILEIEPENPLQTDTIFE